MSSAKRIGRTERINLTLSSREKAALEAAMEHESRPMSQIVGELIWEKYGRLLKKEGK